MIFTNFALSFCLSFAAGKLINLNNEKTKTQVKIRTESAYVVYVGCYGDSASSRAMSSLGTVTSVQGCYDLASAKNYQYFGVQYGNQCYGSNDIRTTTQYGICPSSTGSVKACTCNKLCDGVGPDTCGGQWATDLYSVVSVVPSFKPTKEPTVKPVALPPVAVPSVSLYDPVKTSTSSYSYVGCYGETLSSRSMISLGGATSISDCYNLATSKSYQYFGLQYGNQCYGSNDFQTSTQYGTCPSSTGTIKACTCNKLCGGVGPDTCGGNWATALYSTVVPSVKPTTKPVSKSSVKPSTKPLAKPSVKPSVKPSAKPSKKPTAKPV